MEPKEQDMYLELAGEYYLLLQAAQLEHELKRSGPLVDDVIHRAYSRLPVDRELEELIARVPDIIPFENMFVHPYAMTVRDIGQVVYNHVQGWDDGEDASAVSAILNSFGSAIFDYVNQGYLSTVMTNFVNPNARESIDGLAWQRALTHFTRKILLPYNSVAQGIYQKLGVEELDGMKLSLSELKDLATYAQTFALAKAEPDRRHPVPPLERVRMYLDRLQSGEVFLDYNAPNKVFVKRK